MTDRRIFSRRYEKERYDFETQKMSESHDGDQRHFRQTDQRFDGNYSRFRGGLRRCGDRRRSVYDRTGITSKQRNYRLQEMKNHGKYLVKLRTVSPQISLRHNRPQITRYDI